MLVGRRFGGTPAMSLPSIRTTPPETASNPAITRSRVVFPQPDGPRSEKNSPSAISRSTARRAW